MLSEKTCLITGVSGFVGGYLALELLKSGFEVHGTCFKDAENVMPGLNIALHELNILDKEGIEKLFREIAPKRIFHLSAQSSPALSWKNPALTIDVNVKGVLNVLEALKEVLPESRLLLIGSSDQYGDTPLGSGCMVCEDMPQRPTNPYSASKVAQDNLGRVYAKGFGLNIVISRAFNHAGPRQGDGFVLASFAKQIAEVECGKRKPVLFVGNLDAKRDFTDVRDIVRAYALLIEKGVPGEAYNVGSGRAYAIRELLGKLLCLSSTNIDVRNDPACMRPSDTPLLVCDNKKLAEATLWAPEIPIEKTLADTLEYWREMVFR